MNEMERGLTFAVRDWPTLAGDAFVAQLTAQLSGSGENLKGLEVTDKNLTGSGGYVFLWEDALAIGDVADALHDLAKHFPPNELAGIATRLLKVWYKMRRVRIKLNEEEFRVLRAVKKGKSSVQAIAEFTELSRETVSATIDTLRSRTYEQKTPLLEGDGEELSTKF